MKIQRKNTNMFEDTAVPDIFITDIMIHLPDMVSKVYIYILYILKSNNSMNLQNISATFNLSKEETKNILDTLVNENLLLELQDGYEMADLKEKEINRIYIPKVESKSSNKINTTRQKAITYINNTFFKGIMNLSWYTDIDDWFQKYKFDDDVMIALFNYCNEKKKLHRRYLEVVAESWGLKDIKTFNDLENYLAQIENLQKVERQIVKALRLNRNLTQFEIEIVEKWVNEYKYEFDIIEHAIKKTVSKTNPSISYINGILLKWYEKGLNSLEDIKQDTSKYTSALNTKVTEKKKFENREYLDFSEFYDNMK